MNLRAKRRTLCRHKSVQAEIFKEAPAIKGNTNCLRLQSALSEEDGKSQGAMDKKISSPTWTLDIKYCLVKSDTEKSNAFIRNKKVDRIISKLSSRHKSWSFDRENYSKDFLLLSMVLKCQTFEGTS